MRKFLVTLFLSLAIATPVMAQPYYDQRPPVYRERNNNDAVIAGIVGGAIIGGLLGSQSNRNRDYYPDHRRYVEPYPRYNRRFDPYYGTPYFCVTEQQVDRFGRIYFERRCR